MIDREWFQRVAAAGYEIEKRHNRYVVLDPQNKVLRSFQRRYEAEAYLGKRVGRELREIQHRIEAAALKLVEERAERYPTTNPEWQGSLPAEYFGSVVYRALAYDGQVLYVGVTDNLWARMAGHRQGRSWNWWRGADRIEWTFYPDRDKAEEAEAAAIRQHRPPYNTVGLTEIA